jgi:hypothetical protein
VEFSIKSGSPEKLRTGAVIVGVYESRKLTPAAAAIDAASKGRITDIVGSGDMEGKAGNTLLLHKLSRSYGMGSRRTSFRWRDGSHEPPKFIVLQPQATAAKANLPPKPDRAGRQGHHLRHRRHLASSPPRHGRDEVRHVRRRLVLGTMQGIARTGLPMNVVGVVPACREHAGRQRDQARRRRHQHVRPDHRGPEHRRRGPPDPVRRAHLRRALRARNRDRHRHPHRRLRHRARQPRQRPAQPTTTSWPTSCSRRPSTAGDRAWRCRCGTNTRSS